MALTTQRSTPLEMCIETTRRRPAGVFARVIATARRAEVEEPKTASTARIRSTGPRYRPRRKPREGKAGGEGARLREQVRDGRLVTRRRGDVEGEGRGDRSPNLRLLLLAHGVTRFAGRAELLGRHHLHQWVKRTRLVRSDAQIGERGERGAKHDQENLVKRRDESLRLGNRGVRLLDGI